MVFFTCNSCGDSVKKNQADKHRYCCRTWSSYSCSDCGKDFAGDSYQSHIKCMTEEEKYAGAFAQQKSGSRKGEVKQQQWTEQVKELIASKDLPPNVRGILCKIQSFDNIPRKKPKFANFLKTNVRVFNEALINDVWSCIEKHRAKQSAAVGANSSPPKPVAKDGVESPAAVANGTVEASEPTDDQTEQNPSKKKTKSKKPASDVDDKEVAPPPAESNADDESSAKKTKKQLKNKKSAHDDAESSHAQSPSADTAVIETAIPAKKHKFASQPAHDGLEPTGAEDMCDASDLSAVKRKKSKKLKKSKHADEES